jgi:hypothetical protein
MDAAEESICVFDAAARRWCRRSLNLGDLRSVCCVLLTRARQGMVIFVPPGPASDPTRKADFYDSTFNYLRELGIPAL